MFLFSMTEVSVTEPPAVVEDAGEFLLVGELAPSLRRDMYCEFLRYGTGGIGGSRNSELSLPVESGGWVGSKLACSGRKGMLSRSGRRCFRISKRTSVGIEVRYGVRLRVRFC